MGCRMMLQFLKGRFYVDGEVFCPCTVASAAAAAAANLASFLARAFAFSFSN